MNQVVQNYAPVVAFVGKEGTGKSMAALEMARILHEEINVLKGDFDPKENLCYEVVEFLEIVKDNSRQAIIFDEAGVNVSSKTWYEDMNRAINQTIQTMRYKSNVYIFVLPKLKDLDKSIRERIDLRIEMNKPGVADPTIYEYNFGKMDGDNRSERKQYFLETWTPDLPPDEHKDAYREKEIAFKEKNVEDWIDEIVRQKKEEEQEKTAPNLSELVQSGEIELD